MAGQDPYSTHSSSHTNKHTHLLYTLVAGRERENAELSLVEEGWSGRTPTPTHAIILGRKREKKVFFRFFLLALTKQSYRERERARAALKNFTNETEFDIIEFCVSFFAYHHHRLQLKVPYLGIPN